MPTMMPYHLSSCKYVIICNARENNNVHNIKSRTKPFNFRFYEANRDMFVLIY